MPITRFQSDVLRLLAAQRSPDSYIAGGIAINREGPRFSGDVDIFHDSDARLDGAAKADAAALAAAGYTITWLPNQRTAKREATIERAGEQMQLEWVTDAAFRFFPTQPDELFGYVLHPVDLAANKASAAADRRVPRDVVDLVTIHENILQLGAVVAAAVGKFPGTTPEEMLAEITRHSRFTAEEFQVLATERPIDVRDLHRRIRSMIGDAEDFIARLPSDAIGVVFLDGGRPVQPDVTALERYQRHAGAVGGLWPSSPGIGDAMLDRYAPKL
ncbi:MAG: nucleotidyl transferase AbiEii/AbiGii toxin family protein [Alphaproteobacteria bacterium]|nr:nucleotidyl transferase AbiEii/AbiGii toxin family protein [Alphaproteobacteria bacterium]